jgi:thiol-disulfide isomerase/thioredoxin
MILMRHKIFYAVFSILIFTGCGSNRHATGKTDSAAGMPGHESAAAGEGFDYSSQATWLLGYFNPALLRQVPHEAWFNRGYDEYRTDSESMIRLNEIHKDGISIKIVMGTWCPDSRREVPRFMKILDKWQFPDDKVTFIGVDNEKLSPVGEYEKLDIHRVPTFIIYENNIEAGRIIENPETSLEQDMVNILGGMKNNK